MRRRRPLSIPYGDQAAALVALLDPEAPSVPAPRDPSRFVAAVLHHNVGGFAVAAIERGALSLDDRVRERLLSEHAIGVLHAALLRAELATVEPVLAAACGARPILLKGPAVSDRYYGDWRLRPFADLDVLVPADRLRAAAAALSERGFEVLEEFAPGFAERYGHDLHLVRRVGEHPLLIELHWRIGDDRVGVPLDHARIAARAVAGEVDGTPVALASDADQLLILALHLLSDRAKRLAWIHDLARVGAAASDAAWQDAFRVADELGLTWVLHRALDYPRRYLAFDRPRPLAAGPPPRWGPLRAVEEIDAHAAPHLGHLLALGWGERAAYLRTVLLPGRRGLDGTVGLDGRPAPVLVARHVWRVARALAPRR